MVVIETSVLLPFFLVLALVYGGLEVSGTFKNKGVKGLISLVVAFFAITSAEMVALINSIMPYAALFFIGFFLLGLLLSPFKKDKEGKERDPVLAVVIVGLVLLFLSRQEHLGILDVGNQNFLALAVLLLIALIFYGAYKTQGGKSD